MSELLPCVLQANGLWNDLHRFRDTGPEPEQAAAIRDAQVAKYRISSSEAP